MTAALTTTPVGPLTVGPAPASNAPPSIVLATSAQLVLLQGGPLVKVALWRPIPPPGSGWKPDPMGAVSLSAAVALTVAVFGNGLDLPLNGITSEASSAVWVPGSPPDPRMAGASDPTNCPWPVPYVPPPLTPPIGAIFVQLLDPGAGGPVTVGFVGYVP
jgi:hypothetical protein